MFMVLSFNIPTDLIIVFIKSPLQTETLYLVSKTSVVDPSYVQVFQPAITFVKENRFYSDIIPAIKYFEEISNVPDADRVDAFVKCFGSRISLDPGKHFYSPLIQYTID